MEKIHSFLKSDFQLRFTKFTDTDDAKEEVDKEEINNFEDQSIEDPT